MRSLGRVLLATVAPARGYEELQGWHSVAVSATPWAGVVTTTVVTWLTGIGWPWQVVIAAVVLLLLAIHAAWRLQRKVDGVSGPRLQLGAPVEGMREWLRFPTHKGTAAEIAEVQVWRIPVFNIGADAQTVSVSVETVAPALPHQPGWEPILRLHRPNNPTEGHFRLAHGETVFVDLIAGSDTFAGGARWVANTTAHDGYIYYEDEINAPEWREIRVVARAGLASAIEDYSLWCVEGNIDLCRTADRLRNEAEFNRRLAAGELSDFEKDVLGLTGSVLSTEEPRQPEEPA